MPCLLKMIFLSLLTTCGVAEASAAKSKERKKETHSAAAAALPSPQTSASDRWEFTVTPYLWIANLDATVGILGFVGEVNVSSDAIFDNLKAGFAARFQANRGRWSVFTDFLFLSVETDKVLGPTSLVATLGNQVLLFEGGAGYRIGPPSRFGEIIAGARYTHLNFDFDVADPLPLHIDFGQDWVDPFVGCRFSVDVGKRFKLLVRGDVGGFGVGSDFSWSAEGGASVRLTRHLGLQFLYRALDQDYDEGGGTRFIWDARIHGGTIGLQIHF